MLTSSGASTGAKRALALLAAAAMVGVSLAARALVLDENGTGDGGGGDSGPSQLVCVTELADACRDLAARSGGDVSVTIEEAGTTAARLEDAAPGSDVGMDGWLTLAPWPDIVAGARARANGRALLGDVTDPIARSPLVLVVRTDRAAALTPRCPDRALGWRCLGDVAGTPWTNVGGKETWGSVKLAHEDAAGSASGTLIVGQAVGQYLSTPDIPVSSISRNDWESSDEFSAWFQRLEGAVPSNGFDPPAGSPFAQFLQGRFVEYDAVAALEAEVAPALASASGIADAVRVVYPDPVGTADIVFVPLLDSRSAGRLADHATGAAAREVLAAAGWRVEGEKSAAGVPDSPALPDGSGLPSAGALDALRTLWEEVTR